MLPDPSKHSCLDWNKLTHLLRRLTAMGAQWSSAGRSAGAASTMLHRARRVHRESDGSAVEFDEHDCLEHSVECGDGLVELRTLRIGVRCDHERASLSVDDPDWPTGSGTQIQSRLWTRCGSAFASAAFEITSSYVYP